jgi:hypothetical protein
VGAGLGNVLSGRAAQLPDAAPTRVSHSLNPGYGSTNRAAAEDYGSSGRW